MDERALKMSVMYHDFRTHTETQIFVNREKATRAMDRFTEYASGMCRLGFIKSWQVEILDEEATAEYMREL